MKRRPINYVARALGHLLDEASTMPTARARARVTFEIMVYCSRIEKLERASRGGTCGGGVEGVRV